MLQSREAFAAIKSVAGEVYDLALAGLSESEKRALVKGLNAIIANLSDGETLACDPTNTAKGNAARTPWLKSRKTSARSN